MNTNQITKNIETAFRAGFMGMGNAQINIDKILSNYSPESGEYKAIVNAAHHTHRINLLSTAEIYKAD